MREAGEASDLPDELKRTGCPAPHAPKRVSLDRSGVEAAVSHGKDGGRETDGVVQGPGSVTGWMLELRKGGSDGETRALLDGDAVCDDDDGASPLLRPREALLPSLVGVAPVAGHPLDIRGSARFTSTCASKEAEKAHEEGEEEEWRCKRQ